MERAQPYQLDLQYKGRQICVIAAPLGESSGWGWAALIDGRAPIEHKGRAFASAAQAMTDAETHAKDYVDSFDD